MHACPNDGPSIVVGVSWKTIRREVRMPDLHEDVPLFREALRFTQVQTGFAARRIEKDYFCTVLLAYLAESDPSLVF
jgi:hypothetical protein